MHLTLAVLRGRHYCDPHLMNEAPEAQRGPATRCRSPGGPGRAGVFPCNPSRLALGTLQIPPPPQKAGRAARATAPDSRRPEAGVRLLASGRAGLSPRPSASSPRSRRGMRCVRGCERLRRDRLLHARSFGHVGWKTVLVPDDSKPSGKPPVRDSTRIGLPIW